MREEIRFFLDPTSEPREDYQKHTKFLWWPKTVNGERRWLRTATWVYNKRFFSACDAIIQGWAEVNSYWVD